MLLNELLPTSESFCKANSVAVVELDSTAYNMMNISQLSLECPIESDNNDEQDSPLLIERWSSPKSRCDVSPRIPSRQRKRGEEEEEDNDDITESTDNSGSSSFCQERKEQQVKSINNSFDGSAFLPKDQPPRCVRRSRSIQHLQQRNENRKHVIARAA